MSWQQISVQTSIFDRVWWRKFHTCAETCDTHLSDVLPQHRQQESFYNTLLNRIHKSFTWQSVQLNSSLWLLSNRCKHGSRKETDQSQGRLSNSPPMAEPQKWQPYISGALRLMCRLQEAMLLYSMPWLSKQCSHNPLAPKVQWNNFKKLILKWQHSETWMIYLLLHKLTFSITSRSLMKMFQKGRHCCGGRIETRTLYCRYDCLERPRSKVP